MTPRTDAVLLRFRCRGHSAIRATHDKTLEFTTGTAITGRATCVIGTDVRWETAPAAAIAGPIRLRLAAGGDQVTVHALANPGWQPDRGIVIRRSASRLPDTLGTDADLSAADLGRALLPALSDPASEFEVTVERATPASGGASLVLLAAAGDPGRLPRLLAEAAAADVIVAEDPAAQALLRAHGMTAKLIAPGSRRPDTSPANPNRTRGMAPTGPAAAFLSPAIAAGHRVLAAACEALPGRSVLGWLGEPGDLVIEVAGLTPLLASAAASPSRAPVLMLDGARPRELRALVRAAPPATRLAFRTQAAGLPGVCRAVGGMRPLAAVTALRDGPGHAWRALRLSPDQIAASVPARVPVACCLDPATSAAGPADDTIRDLLAALARQQVPARALASALAEMPGWSRNRAYAFVTGIVNQSGERR